MCEWLWDAIPILPSSDLHAHNTVKIGETVGVRDAVMLSSKAVRNKGKFPFIHWESPAILHVLLDLHSDVDGARCVYAIAIITQNW